MMMKTSEKLVTKCSLLHDDYLQKYVILFAVFLVFKTKISNIKLNVDILTAKIAMIIILNVTFFIFSRSFPWVYIEAVINTY